ncbi:hypothetical protein ACFXPV_28090 [Streptomyces sp. NPDC059118]
MTCHRTAGTAPPAPHHTARTPRCTGVIPPVVTPLMADGEIDRAGLARV